jgi:thiol-disulfide isomerase/thioredoxin
MRGEQGFGGSGFSWIGVAMVAIAACTSLDAAVAQPTVEYALGLAPVQKGVAYTQVKQEEAAKVTLKMEKDAGGSAWVVRGPSGEKLRSFADTNGDRVVDRWSYYRDGIEVYRDIDANHNAKPDQSRWLAGDGMRWGLDEDENGTIDRWKAISAEEATAQVVEAISRRDAAAFQRMLPTPKDLELAGFSGEKLDELNKRVAKAQESFAKLVAAASPAGKMSWSSMLASGQPGVMPADGVGLAKDVAIYDTVMALVDIDGRSGQVYVGPLVKCGDAWRPLDSPQIPGAKGEIADAGGFFSRSPASATQPDADPAASDSLRPLLTSLRELEETLSSAADPKERAGLVASQVEVLGRVVDAAQAEEKSFWVKQLAETLSAAVQERAVDDGIARLEKLAAGLAGEPPLEAYVLFRLASARYAWNMQQKGADVDKVQAAWIEELRQFVEKHPTAPDAAEAILQMGISEEFSGREKEALERYAQIVKDFPDSNAGRKARGAIRRLESVGQPLSLEGKTTDGRSLSIQSLKGTPVLVHYWATWCEPCKVDMARIRELYEKYGGKRLAVVGIALDGDRKQLAGYLASKPLPWPCLHEAGGLDGRLAEEFGVLTLPTMILVGADGNVVDRNVSIADLEKKIDEALAAK